MARRNNQPLSGEYQSEEKVKNACPFCKKEFLRLGSHLPQCRKRNQEDYSCYLSQKTLNNRSKTAKEDMSSMQEEVCMLGYTPQEQCYLQDCSITQPYSKFPSLPG